MIDYSKWNNIEISDDEDDVHPNIDTPSLFRWRHQARVERMTEKENEKMQLEKEKKEFEDKKAKIKSKLKSEESGGDKEKSLQSALSQLELEGEQIKKKQLDFEKKEKLEPWNVDTIAKDGFSKTVINKTVKPNDDDLTEEEKEDKMRIFVKSNEKLIKQYGMFKKHDDSMKFMAEHSQLACDETANYLVIWCLNLMMEDKQTLMEHVAHQAICIQFILELAKQLERDPRSCVSAFFHRIQKAEPEYISAFNAELEAFKSRITKRAAEKVEEAYAEAKEEERKERLGPGGLDPLEVLETLPEELKSCFESQNIALLKETIGKMEPAVAALHMKRCVDSGLWVPEAGESGLEGDGLVDPKDSDDEKEGEEEDIYEEAVAATESK